jgi:hypothetical protein
VERLAQRVAATVEGGEQPVGGEDGEPGVGHRAEEHQRVAVLALAADLLGVDARGLVAVVAVGDQELGIGEGVADGGDGGLVGAAPDRGGRAVGVGGGAEGRIRGRGLECRPGRALWVGVEAEDGGEVRARGAGQVETILLRAGLGALVGTDPALAVVLHADAAEEPVADAAVAVGCRVLLGGGPERGLAVLGDDPLLAPRLEGRLGVEVPVAAARGDREVDLDDVQRAALDELGALGFVDDVVGGRCHGVERADGAEVVVEGAQGLDLGHCRGTLQRAGVPPPGAGDEPGAAVRLTR